MSSRSSAPTLGTVVASLGISPALMESEVWLLLGRGWMEGIMADWLVGWWVDYCPGKEDIFLPLVVLLTPLCKWCVREGKWFNKSKKRSGLSSHTIQWENFSTCSSPDINEWTLRAVCVCVCVCVCVVCTLNSSLHILDPLFRQPRGFMLAQGQRSWLSNCVC